MRGTATTSRTILGEQPASLLTKRGEIPDSKRYPLKVMVIASCVASRITKIIRIPFQDLASSDSDPNHEKVAHKIKFSLKTLKPLMKREQTVCKNVSSSYNFSVKNNRRNRTKFSICIRPDPDLQICGWIWI